MISMKYQRSQLLTMMATVLTASIPVAAYACDNPVFRYALQNWSPADFEVVLLQVTDLSEDERAAWQLLQQEASKSSGRPNVRVRQARPEELEQNAETAVEKSPATNGNSLMLFAPSQTGRPGLIWQGACTAENVERILRSPARQQIGERLLVSEAIVWVWVEPGPKGEGSEHQSTLQDFLTNYIATIESTDAAAAAAPPPQNASVAEVTKPPVDKSAFWPPRFSTLEIAADDPAEEVFIAQLKRTLRESDSIKEPMVFAVFGRGRVLGGLAASQLSPASLRSACDFLTGACSCEVKDKNPGDDLLLAVDWSSVSAQDGASGLISLLALDPEPTSAPIQGSPSKPEPAASVDSTAQNTTSVVEDAKKTPVAPVDSQKAETTATTSTKVAPSEPEVVVPPEPVRLSWIAAGAVVLLLLITILSLRRS